MQREHARVLVCSPRLGQQLDIVGQLLLQPLFVAAIVYKDNLLQKLRRRAAAMGGRKR